MICCKVTPKIKAVRSRLAVRRDPASVVNANQVKSRDWHEGKPCSPAAFGSAHCPRNKFLADGSGPRPADAFEACIHPCVTAKWTICARECKFSFWVARAL